MLLLFALMDAPIFVKVIILFLITLVVFTVGIAFERFAILSFQEKSSKDFDKEFNSGEMLDVIFNKLSNKTKIHAPLARIFFVGMKELTQSNIRSIDFSEMYAEDVKRNIRVRMLSMTSIEQSQIALEMKGSISFLVAVTVVAPLIGLLGTLYGLMHNIHDFSSPVSYDAISGIYSSLASFVISLAVSVVAIITYNILVAKINHYTMEHDLFGIKVSNILSRELDFITTNAYQRKAIEMKQKTQQ